MSEARITADVNKQVKGFQFGTQISTILGMVPRNMSLLIFGVTYTPLYGTVGTLLGGTILAELDESRYGTQVGTIDTQIMAANDRTENIPRGADQHIIRRVESGHHLRGRVVFPQDPLGSVEGVVVYQYAWGRVTGEAT